jgi:broad specificity phosphatase PhoE
MLSSFIRRTAVIGQSRLPVDLLLVRNGMSQGFYALTPASASDESTRARLSQVHSSKWRLTARGRKEAKMAGEWIRENFKRPFDAYLTGEFLRSLETAAYLELPDAKWVPSLYLRPRDFGTFADMNRQFNNQEFEHHMTEKARDSFYWTPPNGESIAHLSLRSERIMHWIRSHVPADGSAIVVTHKDVIETIRIRIEIISQMEYHDKIANAPPHLSLYHGSVLHYTRRNPDTGVVHPRYQWMRVSTPALGKRAIPTKFETFEVRMLCNKELLEEVLHSEVLSTQNQPDQ